MLKNYHNFHLVDYSPWPYVLGSGVSITTMGGVLYFHYSFIYLIIIGIILIISSMILWFRDVVREGSYLGLHTIRVQKSLKIGMILFIISEILFFFSFFWAFYHSSLSPSIEIGCIWPPKGLNSINAFGVPLLNTAILLSSGATVTWTHFSIIEGSRKNSIIGLQLTIFLGIIFTSLQIFEYKDASFSMSDSIFGSTFFLATGFHGLHVIIGTIFLSVGLMRLIKHHFTTIHHFGFEAAAWYWHFVDVVWLFLFISIYWWGG